MNKMIIVNSSTGQVNKKKIAAALGIVAIFLLVVKILGATFIGENPPTVQESKINKQANAPIEYITKKDNEVNKAAFFAGYRMEREKVRGKQIEALNEIVNSQDNNQQARIIAANRLVKITEDMETEMKTEHLLKSKGYNDCVVIKQGAAATAVIQSGPLADAEKDELKKMLGSATECESEAVSIIVNNGE